MQNKKRTQIILEDFSGNLREYSFTDNEWKILATLYVNRNLSAEDIWIKFGFVMGESTIRRAIYKFCKVGWVNDTTHLSKTLNLYKGGRYMCGETNRKKLYDLTPKGEKAFEEFSKKDKNKGSILM